MKEVIALLPSSTLILLLSETIVKKRYPFFRNLLINIVTITYLSSVVSNSANDLNFEF